MYLSLIHIWPRAATLRIVVGSADTSMATLEIPVTQNAAYDYYYMYGASADALDVGAAYELTRKAAGDYTGTVSYTHQRSPAAGRSPHCSTR